MGSSDNEADRSAPSEEERSAGGRHLRLDREDVVSELGRLGVRLVLQRAVEEEVDDWLGRARYERRAV
jgi:hypothetical protein